ncbi:MAG: ptsI [Gammaproteobacteria bacterium]|nr:ptsI [Gammaproteobacteria bacterium]
MLKILRRIVQEVSSVNSAKEALQIIVERVRSAIETQACSVFLLDRDNQRFILMATEGLRNEAVGKINVSINEGLVGLVGRREEPINLSDAPKHPDFLYHPEIGEERYRAFIGAPIIHQRQLIGVIVVQQEQQRRYDEAEEAFIVTIAAQLGGVLANVNLADLLTDPTDLRPLTITGGAVLIGIPGSQGVAIGNAVVVYPLADLDAVPDKIQNDIDQEIEFFNSALAAASEDIYALSERLVNILPPEEHALFDVYLKMLDSNSLGAEVISIIKTGQWAQGALRRVINQHIKQLEEVDDPYLRERAVDFKDLGRRVLSHLQAGRPAIPDYPEQTILVGDEITASALAEVPEGKLVGVVSAEGSHNSHVAIIARAMGVSTVMGISGLPVSQLEDKELIVDGYSGHVYVSPSDVIRKKFISLAKEDRELDENLAELRDLPAETVDGQQIKLMINTGLIADAGNALSVGAQGVGLYRTEVPFIIRDRFPSEEEQRVIYRQLLKAFAPRPVVMRTLDVGGDKALPYFSFEEDNPFLGWRGLRLTLDHPEVFLVQIRAMLRASVGLDNLKIMLPMVTHVSEFCDAKRLIERAYNEVLEEGEDVTMPPLGVMIEVPSAVYEIKRLAKRADFISVGSNDLAQYILAVDRNNSRVASLYDALYPAILHALIQVVEGAHGEGKMVSICGEMASDPMAAILLLAIGFDTLSMSSTSLLRIKWVIRMFSYAQAKALLEESLTLESASAIRQLIAHAMEKAGLGGLIRAGRY